MYLPDKTAADVLPQSVQELTCRDNLWSYPQRMAGQSLRDGHHTTVGTPHWKQKSLAGRAAPRLPWHCEPGGSLCQFQARRGYGGPRLVVDSHHRLWWWDEFGVVDLTSAGGYRHIRCRQPPAGRSPAVTIPAFTGIEAGTWQPARLGRAPLKESAALAFASQPSQVLPGPSHRSCRHSGPRGHLCGRTFWTFSSSLRGRAWGSEVEIEIWGYSSEV